MATVVAAQDQLIVLHKVSWQTYSRLLEDLADQTSIRVAFDNGEMEITSPTAEHEELNRTVARFLEAVAAALDLDIRSLGSTTFKRKDVTRGFEPDSCFYLQNAAAIKGKTRLDLNIDPPPDLVIEIDITSGSLNKLPIYAALGVPEIWRYREGKVDILLLKGTSYLDAEFSSTLPLVSAKDVLYFIELSRTERHAVWMKAVHEWITTKAGL